MSDSFKIKKDIIKKLERLPQSKLDKVFHFIDSLEDKTKNKNEILAFAGAWKEIDTQLFDELTTGLHRRRNTNSNSRRIF